MKFPVKFDMELERLFEYKQKRLLETYVNIITKLEAKAITQFGEFSP